MHTAAFKMGNQQGPTVKQKKKREREKFCHLVVAKVFGERANRELLN